MNTVAFIRGLLLLPLSLGIALFVCWCAGSEAQDAGKQPTPPEKVAPTKPAKPAREEEEPGPLRPRRSRPLRVEDDDPVPGKPRGAGGAPAAVDLAAEAERTRNTVLKDLFKRLAVPHDRLIFTSPPRIDLVEPLRKFIVLKPGRSVFIKTRRLNDRFELDGSEYSVTLTKDQRIIWYEQYAMDQVEEFLSKRRLEQEPPGSRNFLSRLGMLREAERVLAAVLRFHESARERGVREGAEWDDLEKRLRRKLLEAQLNQLRLYVAARDWEAVGGIASQLVRSHPNDSDLKQELSRLLAQQAEQLFKERDYAGARVQTEHLLEQFPSSPAVETVRARLQKKSLELLSEAEKLLEQGNKAEAAKRLEEARRVWPYSNELRSFRGRLGTDFSVLQVGVRSLPRFLSPATASTDVEKQALDLLFESLVKYRPHAPGGPRYEPVLAADTPQLTPLGRAFQLHRQAFWSDGSRVTAPDVRFTVRLLGESDRAWAELLDRRNAVSITNDAFHVKLTLGQGYLDPLSLMSFKILPESRRLRQADDREFASRPTGSGPYHYEGISDNQAVFVANSFYGARSEKRGQPRIGQVRFYQSTKPEADFVKGRLHLLLDPPSRLVQDLQKSDASAMRFLTLPNRRIWFLAVNHRRGGLEDVRLRRALALALGREQILNECFRAGMANVHRPLNGPYLPDTWAYNPNTGPADPHKPTLAAGLAQEALRERGGKQKLTLRYPAGEEAVLQACELIKKQVQDLKAGLELELIPLSPADLKRAVERDFDYDLAYYSWDYPDHTYWLWPLFAPRDGQNVFGHRDPELESAFRQLLTHREFARVQELTYQIHKRIHEEMPFIPLWQLDTHLVVHPHLELPPQLDALAVFSDVAEWKLDVR